MQSIAFATWPNAFTQAVRQGDIPAAATALAENDIDVLPLDPGDPKRPLARLVPHGVKDATCDPVIAHQWWTLWPDAGLGVIPPHNIVVLDDDNGSLAIESLGLAGTFAERTRRGFHYWGRINDGQYIASAKMPGGDVITGPDRYVVMSPTPPYRPVDPEAPILSFPDNSPLLTSVRRQRTPGFGTIPRPTAEHYRQAERVISRLRTTREDIARAACRLLAGHVESHSTPSEADYDLALLASFWTKDPAVILAVLHLSDLRHERARHANGHGSKWDRQDYLPRTIAAALHRRQELEQGSPPLTCVFMGHPLLQASPNDVSAVILAELACLVSAGEFARLPVAAIAAHCGVNRKTVQRHIARLEANDLIETRVEHQPSGSGVRKIRRARLASPISVLPHASVGSSECGASGPPHAANHGGKEVAA